jgi:hypothetical protein
MEELVIIASIPVEWNNALIFACRNVFGLLIRNGNVPSG